MSAIYFVRHGQASFGEVDYDRLSSTGVRQSQILARHLAKTGKWFDALYCGEMKRQQKTAQELISHYREKKLAVPQPIISAAFNEYDSVAIWQKLVPEMLDEDPSLLKDPGQLASDKKAFQKVFARVMSRWISGRYQTPGISAWGDFARRVRQGIEELTAREGAGKSIAVFTSGGPISVAIQVALGLSDQKTLEIAWQLMNASVTRICYNRQGIMLAGFNDVTHLELEGDQLLLTYR